MSDAHVPLLEAAVQPDKKKIKIVYIIGAVIFVGAVLAAIWGWLFWDEYTYTVQNVITGEVSTTGPASLALSWGIILAVIMPIIYGLMWMSIDLKNPSLGVNNQGLFINREGFKKTFIKWNEFERTDLRDGKEVWLYLRNPEEVVSRQPGFAKAFLKKTYVTDRSPITVHGESEDEQKVVQAISRYAPAS
jgi:hypothetical protein